MPPSRDLEPLIQRIADRDRRAVAELFDASADYVFGTIRRVLGTGDRADDVLQEVYVQVWRTADTFDAERASAWSWLGLLARSRAVDRARADGSYRTAIDDLEERPSRVPVGDPGGTNPERETARTERATLVRRAVEELPASQREALELAFFGGFTHREIAERTDTPLGTVKTRIRSAIGKLRDALGPTLGGRGVR